MGPTRANMSMACITAQNKISEPEESHSATLEKAMSSVSSTSQISRKSLCRESATLAMEPWLDDLADDLQSISFNSATTTTATEIHRSTSSGSEATWTAASSGSSHFLPPPPPSSAKSRSAIPSGDPCWDAIRRALSSSSSASPSLSVSDLRFIHRLGSGDIGAVYLAEVKAPPPPAEPPQPQSPSPLQQPALFAAKVMDKKELASRNKEGRARTEREILEMLDHPFLPTLYASIDSPKWSCLLTEFAPGGDLHVLRQRQPAKRFPESSVRFYASEVIVAIEYVHMMGIVYRDLKPENVLVRSDGHIMLTDFDLSLKCDTSTSTPAQVISGQNTPAGPAQNQYSYAIDPPKFTASSCILPNCIVPAVSCFHPNRKRKKKKPGQHSGPEFVAEPVDVRSMSFVGTHEYLAPEIVSGEGHGSAVDWWTLGIFIFELLYGVTPFRGVDNELTLANIVARALEFPKEPPIPAAAKDLISQLLVKDPARRMGSTMGATAIKHHPFFHGVNWALLRCTPPPFVPPPYARDVLSDESCPDTPVEYY
ncbi:PREDICTED: serine/threonine-protein kinase D6PK [Ipomoea nil]|uniref:serine/threonine-protein kinase D6PK n=1 Tax=Ipomoea nil TaxID=35883 RepID=UPI000900FD75|nr:PREDICTED: serine/threonine-protein kinase D6PK [Ipomoea nil]